MTDAQHTPGGEAPAKRIQRIVSRYYGVTLFECVVPDEVEPGLALRYALEKAVVAHVNLSNADLCGANLSGTDLHGANLSNADLCGANLSGTDLHGANLSGADLHRADLHGADLGGADLHRADLSYANLRYAYLSSAYLGSDIKLSGERPFIQVGPIGSRKDVLQGYVTEKGLYLRAGCFFGTRDEFVAALDAEHGDSKHGREYRAALALIDLHAELWPATVSAAQHTPGPKLTAAEGMDIAVAIELRARKADATGKPHQQLEAQRLRDLSERFVEWCEQHPDTLAERANATGAA